MGKGVGQPIATHNMEDRQLRFRLECLAKGIRLAASPYDREEAMDDEG